MKASNHLIKARKLIKKGWVKNFLYADRYGKETKHTKAVRFCMLGALYVQRRDDSYPESYLNNAIMLSTDGYENNISDYNDESTTSKSDVLFIYDLAIEMALKDNK